MGAEQLIINGPGCKRTSLIVIACLYRVSVVYCSQGQGVDKVQRFRVNRIPRFARRAPGKGRGSAAGRDSAQDIASLNGTQEYCLNKRSAVHSTLMQRRANTSSFNTLQGSPPPAITLP